MDGSEGLANGKLAGRRSRAGQQRKLGLSPGALPLHWEERLKRPHRQRDLLLVSFHDMVRGGWWWQLREGRELDDATV